MADPPRSAEERKRDTLARLEHDIDLWAASASAEGDAMLVPLSFAWDGEQLMLTTPRQTKTARNLARAGVGRVALGATRDVVMIDGSVEVLDFGADPELEDVFARKTGWDPRKDDGDYVVIRLRPQRIQAWREVNELPDRHIMRDGSWV
jgi:hypothetical protein